MSAPTDPTEPLTLDELRESIHAGPTWRGLLRLGVEAVVCLRELVALGQRIAAAVER